MFQIDSGLRQPVFDPSSASSLWTLPQNFTVIHKVNLRRNIRIINKTGKWLTLKFSLNHIEERLY